MGDRAYVRITCRRRDAERFEELGFVADEPDGDAAMSMVDDEAHYAHYSALTALAQAGIVFFGWHDAGCEYDGSMFASDGAGEYHDVLSTPNELLALARVKPDGSIAEGDLDRVREYYATLARARAELGSKEDGPG
ncbi:MAG: hypothetical protein KIT09_16115 [Bryobacteraceae bacterium]|nr:hypothetical protein [Bryobacteraceae bacterium]